MKKKKLITRLLLITLIISIILAGTGLIFQESEPSKSEMDESTGTTITSSVKFFFITKLKPENSRFRVNFNVFHIAYKNTPTLLWCFFTLNLGKEYIFKETPNYIKNLVILS